MKIQKLSIIVPTYNEEKTIETILERLKEVDLGVEKEIIVVDDGSRDGTKLILGRYLGSKDFKIIFSKENRGKGAALRLGFKEATGDYTIIQDADLEYNPEDIKNMIKKAEEENAKVVYGSRTLIKNPRGGFFYDIGGHFLSWLANLLYGTEITDEPTCYKIFETKLLQSIPLNCVGFEFCPEITAKVALLNIKIYEVPISYIPRSTKEGKKKKIRDGITAVWTLLRYRLFYNIRFSEDIRGSIGYKRPALWTWPVILGVFILSRFIIFATFWQASLNKGGWENFYGFTPNSRSVFLIIFHDYCDWHPPLYYTFSSVLLFLTKTQWSIYLIQVFLGFLSLIFAYKICRLFFSRKISLITSGLIVIEPYWAWHNWLLASENVFIPLFLIGMYYFLRFIGDVDESKMSLCFYNKTISIPFFSGKTFVVLHNYKIKILFLSALFLGLATLTRTNALLLAAGLSLLLLLFFLLKGRMGLEIFRRTSLRQLFVYLIIFNIIFIIILAPWVVRNKTVYDRFVLTNLFSNNFYFYNLTPLIAWQNDISEDEAESMLFAQAERDLGGAHVGKQGDCKLFSVEEFNRQQDYYNQKTKEYILSNPVSYIKMHLLKAIPFFLQSGYLDMWKGYVGKYEKPNITTLILKRDFPEIKKFLSNTNASTIVYLLGLTFWGISSLAVVISLIYSYFKDKGKFLFFAISLVIIVYTALLTSTFVTARYRLPLYVFFLAPLVYIINVIYNRLFRKNRFLKNHE